MAGMNSHTIYKEVTGSKVSRRKFLLSLAEELAQINESTQEQVISPANSQLSRKNVKLKKSVMATNQLPNVLFVTRLYMVRACKLHTMYTKTVKNY